MSGRDEVADVRDCPYCEGAGCSECDNTGQRVTTHMALGDGTVLRVAGSRPLTPETQEALADVAEAARSYLTDEYGKGDDPLKPDRDALIAHAREVEKARADERAKVVSEVERTVHEARIRASHLDDPHRRDWNECADLFEARFAPGTRLTKDAGAEYASPRFAPGTGDDER